MTLVPLACVHPFAILISIDFTTRKQSIASLDCLVPSYGAQNLVTATCITKFLSRKQSQFLICVKINVSFYYRDLNKIRPIFNKLAS